MENLRSPESQGSPTPEGVREDVAMGFSTKGARASLRKETESILETEK